MIDLKLFRETNVLSLKIGSIFIDNAETGKWYMITKNDTQKCTAMPAVDKDAAELVFTDSHNVLVPRGEAK